MSFDLSSIKRGVEHKAPRIVLLGVEKIGKSTFAAGADNPIFLPIKGEEGVDDLDVAKFPRAETFDDVLNAVSTLITEDHEFKTFIIDSASALEPVIWQKLCDESNCDSIEKVGGGYGKGYIEAANKWRDLMEGLDMLRRKGIACILIGHVKVKRFDDPLGASFDQYQFDLHEKVHLALQRWADSILFCQHGNHRQDRGGWFQQGEEDWQGSYRQAFLVYAKASGSSGRRAWRLWALAIQDRPFLGIFHQRGSRSRTIITTQKRRNK